MLDLSQSRIGQIAVVCKDVARATTFYRDTLGLRFLFSAGPTLSFFDCGGVRLMLTTAEQPEHDHPGSILYFFVTDIAETHNGLSAKGVHLRRRAAHDRPDARPPAVARSVQGLRGKHDGADGGEALGARRHRRSNDAGRTGNCVTHGNPRRSAPRDDLVPSVYPSSSTS